MEPLTVDVSIRVNGDQYAGAVSTSMLLVDLVRGELGLLGTRVACGVGACGSCTCLVDGEPVAACTIFAWDVDGSDVETIEGLADGGKLNTVQQAFVDCSGFQCGYCTSGMVLLASALLRGDRHPTDADVARWMASNTCRCTGYASILRAVQRARQLGRGEGDR